ncbi:hypothetical protein AB0F81_45765 [Actinoplanes sp. NPDC024001]|uniref:hypothetical protein n=1 Tax=Actinoplanes sp. NPDC024001 TaxID=3154598 RepID=UPI0033F73C15
MSGPTCFYVPDHLIDHLARNARQLGLDPDPARRTAIASRSLRGRRQLHSGTTLDTLLPPRPADGERQIFDDQHQWVTGVKMIRDEDDRPAAAANVNAAHDGLGATRAR